jgi:hypothetical protein
MRKVILVVSALVFSGCASGEVLWDQLTGLDSAHGFASQDFEEQYDWYDCWGGDDFEVPEPGWVIESCDWTAYFMSYGYAEVHEVNFYVWPDRGDGYGDFYHPLFTESGMYDLVLYDGDVHYDFAAPIALSAGHYIFGVQPAMDFATWGQHFWFVTTMEQRGTEFSMYTWWPNGEWSNPGAPDKYDASFRLSGRVIPEPAVVSLGGVLFALAGMGIRGRGKT